MAEFLVTLVVEKVGELLVQETKFTFGVREQFGQLQAGLREMQCFVKDADRTQDDSETLQNLVIEIREVALDAEDMLEVFKFKVIWRDRTRPVLSVKDRISMLLSEIDWFTKKGIRYYTVGSKIQGVNNKIGKLTPRLQAYGIRAAVVEGEGPSSRKERQNQLRRTYSHVIEHDFVGFEEDLNLLVSKLVEGYGNRRVVSICGMGGLGKTTLAKRVYHHSAVRSHFSCFAWVCISQTWEKVDVLKSILIKLIPEETNETRKMMGDELVKRLFQVQMNKKCLVVLDDIWMYEVWNTLRAAFPDGDSVNSRLLLTTRKKEVAFHIDRHAYSHTLGFLNKEASLQLLMKKAAFGTQDRKFDINMEKAEEILRRCGGLPIAIVALGGLLANTQTLNECESVIRRIDMILNKGECVIKEPQTVQQLLSLSYDDLPYALKSCFLYFGNFQENYNVSTEKLCLLWVAEGMVSSEDKGEEETLLDVAERYLVELVRSMIQVESRDEHWWVWGISRNEKTCRLHDLMRELCLFKRKKEGIKQSQGNANDSSYSSIDLVKTRKLAVYFGMPVDLPDVVEFKLLRVLDFEGFDFGMDMKLPKAIGKLIHLKFLSFRNCEIRAKFFWPVSSGNFSYLQVLDLRADIYRNVLALMANFFQKLGTLRHLYLSDNHMGYFRSSTLNSLSDLETLGSVDLRGFGPKGLLRLTKLRKLKAEIIMREENQLQPFIDYLNDNSLMLRQSSLRVTLALGSTTEEFCHVLRKLFTCRRLKTLMLEGRIYKLPEYQNDNFSTSLTDISLSQSELQEDPLKILEKLPNLQTLVFSNSAYIGKKMVCSSGGFPQLTRLGLQNMPNLEDWLMEKGTLVMLASMRIDCCEKLKMLPEGLKFLTNLKELHIEDMSDALKQAVQAEDSYKIQHVTVVNIL